MLLEFVSTVDTSKPLMLGELTKIMACLCLERAKYLSEKAQPLACKTSLHGQVRLRCQVLGDEKFHLGKLTRLH